MFSYWVKVTAKLMNIGNLNNLLYLLSLIRENNPYLFALLWGPKEICCMKCLWETENTIKNYLTIYYFSFQFFLYQNWDNVNFILFPKYINLRVMLNYCWIIVSFTKCSLIIPAFPGPYWVIFFSIANQEFMVKKEIGYGILQLFLIAFNNFY